MRLRDLNEELQCLLSCALIPSLQGVPDDCQLLRNCGLEFIPFRWLLQFLVKQHGSW